MTLSEFTEYLNNFVDETVDYYQENPRAVGEKPMVSSCFYAIKKDGKDCFCAVGRCLLDPFKFEETYGGYSILGVKHDAFQKADMVEINNLMKDEYFNLPIEFLAEVQALHDDNINWMDAGNGGNILTPSGHHCVKALFAMIQNKAPDWYADLERQNCFA